MIAQVDTFVAPEVDWWALAPQLTLITGALVVLLVTALGRELVPKWFPSAITVVSGVVTLAFCWRLWNDVTDDGPRSVLEGALAMDGFAVFFTVLVAVAVILSTLVLGPFANRERLAEPELLALVQCAAIGAIVMASANDLIVMFVGLETLSLGLYVMAALDMRRRQSQEAAIKYFVLGGFSSAFLLYGIALTYGATGSTNLTEINAFLDGVVLPSSAMFLVGMALVLVGLGFKVAAVPFHMWAPDVYEGAPTPIAGFMAAVAKAAGFAALLRVFVVAFVDYTDDWTPVVWVLAAASLVVGSLLAIVQTDVKRMLAYSSITHAGYVLVAVESASDEGVAAALFYVFVYAVLVLGSFTAVSLVAGEGDSAHSVEDFRGLSIRRPALALAFTVLLLAQAGVPLTSGFVAKFYAIKAAADTESWWLAVIAMIVAVVAAFLYLRIIVAMYLSEAPSGSPRIAVAPSTAVMLVVAVVFTIGVGVVPERLIEFATDAVPVLVASGP